MSEEETTSVSAYPLDSNLKMRATYAMLGELLFWANVIASENNEELDEEDSK